MARSADFPFLWWSWGVKGTPTTNTLPDNYKHPPSSQNTTWKQILQRNCLQQRKQQRKVLKQQRLLKFIFFVRFIKENTANYEPQGKWDIIHEIFKLKWSEKLLSMQAKLNHSCILDLNSVYFRTFGLFYCSLL